MILCEAPFDALTFWVNGFKNVTFIYGTEGFTDELFDALLARKVRRVRIAYDADDAGNRAAARDAERLTAHGIEVFRVKFPWGMDANEYARKVHTGGEVPADGLERGGVGRRHDGPRPTSPPDASRWRRRAAANLHAHHARASSSESLAADVSR